MRIGLRGRRFGSYLALFALFLQFSLAFGHVELRGSLHHNGLLQDIFENLVTGGPQHPQTEDHGNKRGDSCQLCWLQGAAGSATLSDGAQPNPIALSALVVWYGIARIKLASVELAYRVRAPPIPLSN